MILGVDSNVYVGERRCVKELCSTLATNIVRTTVIQEYGACIHKQNGIL